MFDGSTKRRWADEMLSVPASLTDADRIRQGAWQLFWEVEQANRDNGNAYRWHDEADEPQLHVAFAAFLKYLGTYDDAPVTDPSGLEYAEEVAAWEIFRGVYEGLVG